MTASVQSMWPPISAPSTKPPVVMMREQASLLADLTRGLIEAEVRTRALGSEFVHDFVLVVPALGDYRHELFSVQHGIDLYPARVNPPGAGNPVTCAGFADFEHALREALNSPKTREAVSALTAQVAA